MYILKDLWYGKVNLSERYGRRGSEYMKLTKETSDCIDRLIEELSPKCVELLDEFLDKHMLLNSIPRRTHLFAVFVSERSSFWM